MLTPCIPRQPPTAGRLARAESAQAPRARALLQPAHARRAHRRGGRQQQGALRCESRGGQRPSAAASGQRAPLMAVCRRALSVPLAVCYDARRSGRARCAAWQAASKRCDKPAGRRPSPRLTGAAERNHVPTCACPCTHTITLTCRAVLRHAVLHCAVLCCDMPCGAVRCCRSEESCARRSRSACPIRTGAS
jgi:hypothetical protein